jgi:hypothetical protein
MNVLDREIPAFDDDAWLALLLGLRSAGASLERACAESNVLEPAAAVTPHLLDALLGGVLLSRRIGGLIDAAASQHRECSSEPTSLVLEGLLR